MARDWVHRFFDAAYVGQLRAQWSGAATRKQVAFVARALGLRRGARVLDVPCGFGRHARLLARRGMLVIGVDLSPAMIAEARRGGPQPGLSFVRADMRRLAYQGNSTPCSTCTPRSATSRRARTSTSCAAWPAR